MPWSPSLGCWEEEVGFVNAASQARCGRSCSPLVGPLRWVLRFATTALAGRYRLGPYSFWNITTYITTSSSFLHQTRGARWKIISHSSRSGRRVRSVCYNSTLIHCILRRKEPDKGSCRSWNTPSFRPTCPAKLLLFTNLYNWCHRDSQLYYWINRKTSDILAPYIRRCGKSCRDKRKNHLKTTILSEGFHKKTPGFWQTDHTDRYLGAYRWNERNTNS